MPVWTIRAPRAIFSPWTHTTRSNDGTGRLGNRKNLSGRTIPLNSCWIIRPGHFTEGQILRFKPPSDIDSWHADRVTLCFLECDGLHLSRRSGITDPNIGPSYVRVVQSSCCLSFSVLPEITEPPCPYQVRYTPRKARRSVSLASGKHVLRLLAFFVVQPALPHSLDPGTMSVS